jgi:hypothetical protein
VHSQANLKYGSNCQSLDDFEQQKRLVPRLSKMVSSIDIKRNEGRMARKPITREVLLGAILDVVMGLALTAGTIYVACLCLARVG